MNPQALVQLITDHHVALILSGPGGSINVDDVGLTDWEGDTEDQDVNDAVVLTVDGESYYLDASTFKLAKTKKKGGTPLYSATRLDGGPGEIVKLRFDAPVRLKGVK